MIKAIKKLIKHSSYYKRYAKRVTMLQQTDPKMAIFTAIVAFVISFILFTKNFFGTGRVPIWQILLGIAFIIDGIVILINVRMKSD